MPLPKKPFKRYIRLYGDYMRLGLRSSPKKGLLGTMSGCTCMLNSLCGDNVGAVRD